MVQTPGSSNFAGVNFATCRLYVTGRFGRKGPVNAGEKGGSSRRPTSVYLGNGLHVGIEIDPCQWYREGRTNEWSHGEIEPRREDPKSPRPHQR